MRRLLSIIILLSLSVCGAFAVGESPQALINALGKSLPKVKKSTLDSIKTSLSGRYVEEFRTYGREAAYDSLRLRIRVLEASNQYNTSDTLSSPVQVEQPMSQLERLQKENETLKNELGMLKNGEPAEKELTPLQKRTRWIIKKLLIDNETATDSLMKISASKSNFGEVPLYFDSVSSTTFAPYMQPVKKSKYLMVPLKTEEKYKFQQLCEEKMFIQHVNDRMMFKLIGRNPSSIDYYSLSDYTDEMQLAMKKTESVKGLEEKAENYDNIKIGKLNVKKAKEDPWKSNAKLALQFSQYYVTDNWYKGGEPNATLLGIFDYSHDYKEGKKFWDNDADIKLGFYTSQEDTIHSFRVNNDVLKLTSMIGYQILKSKWYYAAYGEFNTQFFRNYKATNSRVIKASFMSPTRIFLSLGSKYQHNNNVYAYLSPLAYKLLFVVNNDIEDPQTVGIEHGKVQNDFGFFGKGKVKWKFTKDVVIDSNFDIFTPYSMKNVEFDWETVGNFVINRYLSTRLSLKMRFDSTPKSDDYESPKLQIQEQLSFGFNYTFQDD